MSKSLRLETNTYHVGDRVYVKETGRIGEETFLGKFGWIRYIGHKVGKDSFWLAFEDGNSWILNTSQMKDFVDVRDCHTFRALDACGVCEDRFKCYTLKKEGLDVPVDETGR